ncbi:META domain-containing protein [Xanthomonas sp. 3075]|uniref:META domain-containing protein n=1 Tax=Xanthomonas sp. 3075 TaxID=3035315 RepID=UPI0016136C25|nr:META domain-containing protein [Xanthomonas sp. 3075]
MRAVFFAPALLAAGVTACGSGATAGAGSAAPDTTAASTAAAAPVSDNAPLRAALQAQHWQLQQASDAHGTALRSLFVAGSAPLQLDFAEQRIQVSQTCNALGANYSVTQTQLQIGRVVSSKRLCAQSRRMAQERAASDLLSGRFTVALDTAPAAPRLTLTRSDGTRLVFGGVAMANTRYGGTGQTLVVEVAAATVACPSAPSRQCLQLREHDPGAPATAQAATPWHPFDGTIEGYDHEAGIRTLLRVTRYPAGAGPDAGPVYVLDQMIEAGS